MLSVASTRFSFKRSWRRQTYCQRCSVSSKLAYKVQRRDMRLLGIQDNMKTIVNGRTTTQKQFTTSHLLNIKLACHPICRLSALSDIQLDSSQCTTFSDRSPSSQKTILPGRRPSSQKQSFPLSATQQQLAPLPVALLLRTHGIVVVSAVETVAVGVLV